jgi:anti-sigma factor RsiW
VGKTSQDTTSRGELKAKEIMNCDWTDKISLLIDGELEPSTQREVERHLLSCSECQDVQADFLVFRKQLASYQPSPNWNTSAALDKILGTERREPIPQRARRFSFGFRFSPQAVAFAAVAIIALLVGVLAIRSLRGEQQHQYEAQVPIATPNPNTLGPSPSAQGKSVAPKSSQLLADNDKVGKAKKSVTKFESTREVKPREVTTTNASVVAQGVTTSSDANPVRSADTQTLTAMHFESAELLLRAFRNVKLSETGVNSEVSYEKHRAQQLVYRNMMLRREADASGDVQVATLLENLEPILIDIANLPEKPENEDLRVIKDRVERKNIVALLQVNSTALARALD